MLLYFLSKELENYNKEILEFEQGEKGWNSTSLYLSTLLTAGIIEISVYIATLHILITGGV